MANAKEYARKTAKHNQQMPNQGTIQDHKSKNNRRTMLQLYSSKKVSRETYTGQGMPTFFEKLSSYLKKTSLVSRETLFMHLFSLSKRQKMQNQVKIVRYVPFRIVSRETFRFIRLAKRHLLIRARHHRV